MYIMQDAKTENNCFFFLSSYLLQAQTADNGGREIFWKCRLPLKKEKEAPIANASLPRLHSPSNKWSFVFFSLIESHRLIVRFRKWWFSARSLRDADVTEDIYLRSFFPRSAKILEVGNVFQNPELLWSRTSLLLKHNGIATSDSGLLCTAKRVSTFGLLHFPFSRQRHFGKLTWKEI